MDNKENLINPVFIFGNGRCPKCYGPITVLEMETDFIDVNDYGKIINSGTVCRTEGICRACANRFPMVYLYDEQRYIRENDYSDILLWYKQKLHERDILNKMDKVKPTKDNPFMINIK